jgi:hypothetical protein
MAICTTMHATRTVPRLTRAGRSAARLHACTAKALDPSPETPMAPASAKGAEFQFCCVVGRARMTSSQHRHRDIGFIHSLWTKFVETVPNPRLARGVVTAKWPNLRQAGAGDGDDV